MADSPLGADVVQQESKAQAVGTSFDEGSVVHIVQATSVKIVKQEALKQMRVYRVLDAYNHLQKCTFPENVLQALDHLGYRSTGETVAHDVAQGSEKQQVERVMAFVQEHHTGGDLLVQLKEGNEAELRQLQTMVQTELQAQIDEKLQAKEADAIREAEKLVPNPPAPHVAYNLLTQRHLRQAVLILDGGLRLQGTDVNPPGEESHPEDLPVEGPLVDDDLKAILQLLKEKRGCECLLLELKQTVQMLQLREQQYQEVAQVLKAITSHQHLDDADQIIHELREFRQQKTQELKEQLGILLPQDQGPEKSSSTCAGKFQFKSSLSGKEDKERIRREGAEVSQEMRLEELEESYRGQVSAEQAKLQDQLERGEVQRYTMQMLMREHDETVTFLDKTFRQDVGKLRGKAEKEKKKKGARRKSRTSLTTKAASLQQRRQPDLAEDKVVSLLAQSLRIFRQAELLVASRIVLLNPQIRPFLSDADGAGGPKSSQLLTLLKDMNVQIQRCAIAAGLLDPHCPENDAVNSFQDIMNIQMDPGPGELRPLDPPSLSAKEFVIYQYGIVILQFLRPLIEAPEIELCIASSIPPMNAPGNAFRNTFYYQSPSSKLFILRKCLSCVGSFVLLLVHCLAHFASGDFGQDSSPAFRRLFYQALKACLGEMFSLRLQTSAVLEDSKSAARVVSEAFLKGEEIADEKINLLSDLFGAELKTSEERHTGTLLHPELEDLLKSKVSEKKAEYHSCIFSKGQKTSAMSSVAGSCPHSIPKAAEDRLEGLAQKLTKVLEKEQRVPKQAAYEDQTFGEPEEISVEKDSLLREMEQLEGSGPNSGERPE
ncbi:uncharacterized protein LOC125442046 [Sphaerodactylus townsendi]|uniref:uncharacterized protein LOC125442046 n=1 Tax=Sphaerodactylus townsendi TaxID=933632 RepID=UPI002026E069|nr:uncharacterized protein LOC125442046 [Sphaerodactylus townsendi]